MSVTYKSQPTVNSNGRMDFSNLAIPITFPPSQGSDGMSVSIATIDDLINEAMEGYLLVLEIETIAPEDEGTGVVLERDGLALIRILDNDSKSEPL